MDDGNRIISGDRKPRRFAMDHRGHLPRRDDWLTPPEVLQALGPFDLDPCAPTQRPWPTARQHYTIEEDGLAQRWCGRVWLNPPYNETPRWIERLAKHGNGIALLFTRTDTRYFHAHVWGQAEGMFFLRGRICFRDAEGKRSPFNAGAPSVLIAYGRENCERLRSCPLRGFYVALRQEDGD